MGDVVEYRKREIFYTWRCGGCGSETWIIYTDGVVECAACHKLADRMKAVTEEETGE